LGCRTHKRLPVQISMQAHGTATRSGALALYVGKLSLIAAATTTAISIYQLYINRIAFAHGRLFCGNTRLMRATAAHTSINNRVDQDGARGMGCPEPRGATEISESLPAGQSLNSSPHVSFRANLARPTARLYADTGRQNAEPGCLHTRIRVEPTDPMSLSAYPFYQSERAESASPDFRS
jgi:hypothetical protein